MNDQTTAAEDSNRPRQNLVLGTDDVRFSKQQPAGPVSEQPLQG